MKVQLLFFAGCPHVEAARGQLRRAFAALGREAAWEEADAPPGFGSPTVLVDGRDVAPGPAVEGQACRLYLGSDTPGAPPLAAILAALRG